MTQSLLGILADALASLNTYVVIGMCHAQKEAGRGDVELTAHGKEQAFAMLRYLEKEGFTPDIIAYSGAFCTFQMAGMAKSLWSHERKLLPVQIAGFHIAGLVEQLFSGNPRAVLQEAAQVKESGGTVDKAMEMSVFAGLAGGQVVEGILTLASALRAGNGLQNAIFFSHSPLLECGAVDEKHTPYGLGECDAIIWIVKWNEDQNEPRLVASHYIPALTPDAAIA